MNMPSIQLEVTQDSVATLSIHNEHKHNAISVTMWKELAAHVAVIARSQSVRVVIVRGAGLTSFAAGADISSFEKERTTATARHYDETTEEALSSLAALTVPTIAQIHGYCIGGGLSLALACDLRLADDLATFAVPAARLGLAYPPQSLERLVNTLGESSARYLLLSAQRIDAPTALRLGIVHEIHARDALDTRAIELATAIAALAPLSLSAAKLQLRHRQLSRAQALSPDVLDAVQSCLSSQDYQEGQRAFQEKRSPNFTGA